MSNSSSFTMQKDEVCDTECHKFDVQHNFKDQDADYMAARRKLDSASIVVSLRTPKVVCTTNVCGSPCLKTPIRDGTFTLYERDKLDDTFTIEKKVVINLPAYIVNSHALTKEQNKDISKQYNLQLKSPDNENLYVTDHHVLLQVMSQYVYYRKLCIWIKDELKKKRLELLEAARRALIDARDGELCNTDANNFKTMPDRLLTDVEKEFLQKLAEGRADISILNPPRKYSLDSDKTPAKKLPVQSQPKSQLQIQQKSLDVLEPKSQSKPKPEPKHKKPSQRRARSSSETKTQPEPESESDHGHRKNCCVIS